MLSVDRTQNNIMNNTISFPDMFGDKIAKMSEDERYHFRAGLSSGMKEQFDRFVRDHGTLQVAEGSELEKWMSQGYTVVRNSVLYEGDLKPVTRLTYIILLSKLFGKEYTFPGQEALAGQVNSSRREIQRSLKTLNDLGWLRVKRRGLGKTNIYYLIKG